MGKEGLERRDDGGVKGAGCGYFLCNVKDPDEEEK